MPEPTTLNTRLRDHVTSIGFSLTLGKTHIAALVYLDHRIKLNLAGRAQINYAVYAMQKRDLPAAFRHFVLGARGLIDRGLVEHILPTEMNQPGVSAAGLSIRKVWRITRAGRMVINLLKETGLYQDYATHLPPLPSTQAELKALRDKVMNAKPEELIAMHEVAS